MTNPQSGPYVLEVSREYGIYVNATRAIPQETDGLKDAARKALWVMRNRGKTKTVALSGAMTEQLLYVHGAAEDSINTLAAPFKNNLPCLKGLGNFGTKVDPGAFSAGRYTEVMKPEYAGDIIYTDLAVVPMEPNYDGSTEQPQTLLPILPLLLINGSVGIGVGYRCTILPRNPIEVTKAVEDVIAGKTPKRLDPYFSWAPTMGVEFLEYNANGAPVWQFSGRVSITDTSTLVVTELPFDYELEKFKEALTVLEDSGKIKSFEDHSSNEIEVTVKLPRGKAKGWSEDDALEFLGLYTRKTEQLVMVSADKRNIITYWYQKEDPITQYLKKWVEWRFSFYTNRYKNLLDIEEDRLVFLRLIKACHDKKLPSKLKSIRNKDHLEQEINAIAKMVKISVTDDHVSKVASFPTYRWTAEEYKKVVDEIKEAVVKCNGYRDLLSNTEKRRKVFSQEVGSVLSSFSTIQKQVESVRNPD